MSFPEYVPLNLIEKYSIIPCAGNWLLSTWREINEANKRDVIPRYNLRQKFFNSEKDAKDYLLLKKLSE